MSPTYPSIQSFFQPEVRPVKPLENLFSEPGDGFSSSEIEAALDPLKRDFSPSREYDQCDIRELVPGTRAVTFMGRVVNFNVCHGRSKKEAAAKGWHHIILKDDTAAVCVTLYFVGKPYELYFGLLLTIWTPCISSTEREESFAVPDAPLCTSIFPGRDPSTHLVVHKRSDSGTMYRKPIHYQHDMIISGLVTLKSWLDGGYEIPSSKILVCVKSLGPKKPIITKRSGRILEIQHVIVFDDTAEAVLKLWNENIVSVKQWTTSKTILLISNPGHKIDWGKGGVDIQRTTIVDVDPECKDATWLRDYALACTKTKSMKQDVDISLFDLNEFENSPYKILFTISDVDDWARTHPQDSMTGFLNVVLLDMDLSRCRQRNMLMCNECCGVPVFANSLVVACKNCSMEVELALNPKIMGVLVDETGCIGAGRLKWTGRAWQDLFGRSCEELLMMDAQAIKLLEQRMIYTRFTLVFGWAEIVGKMVVLQVRE